MSIRERRLKEKVRFKRHLAFIPVIEISNFFLLTNISPIQLPSITLRWKSCCIYQKGKQKLKANTDQNPWAVLWFKTEGCPKIFSSGDQRTMTEKHGSRMQISTSWGKLDYQREKKVLTHVSISGVIEHRSAAKELNRWPECYLHIRSWVH